MKEATGDWILFLDADERITYPLQLEIANAIKSDQYGGYTLKFPHFFMNRFLYHHYDEVLRLVKRNGAQFSGNVHEKLSCLGKVGRLKNHVLHFTYKGLQNYIRKKESYAWFQAERLHEKGKKATYAHFMFKPLFRFFKSYLVKGGFRDGIPGLAVSALNAYGVFSRYVKMHLLKKGLR